MTLQRSRNRLPAALKARIVERSLWHAWQARPPYQRNDYLGWIARAVRDETKERRIVQMLDELERGGVYMKMKWTGS